MLLWRLNALVANAERDQAYFDKLMLGGVLQPDQSTLSIAAASNLVRGHK
jgi:hypothetical protein